MRAPGSRPYLTTLIVAVVGVTPTGATSAPRNAFTNVLLPLENSPITVTRSGRSYDSTIASASPASSGKRRAAARRARRRGVDGRGGGVGVARRPVAQLAAER